MSTPSPATPATPADGAHAPNGASGASSATEPADASDVALDDHVYEWVRDRIIDGTFPAGTRLRERELAEDLHVSRVPVREAFPRLEAEGYIRSQHRRGVVVAPMELAEIEELFAVRIPLEVLAARLAAERCAAGASGEALTARLLAAEDAVLRNDDDEIAEATLAFHDEIVRLANNRLLQDLMVPVQGRVQRLFHVVTDRDGHHLQHEHRDICSAIINGEVERAAALARAHVEHSRHETMQIVTRRFGDAESGT